MLRGPAELNWLSRCIGNRILETTALVLAWVSSSVEDAWASASAVVLTVGIVLTLLGGSTPVFADMYRAGKLKVWFFFYAAMCSWMTSWLFAWRDGDVFAVLAAVAGVVNLLIALDLSQIAVNCKDT